jgi:hypothetical protein
MTSKIKPSDTAEIKFDEYGISAARCPKCDSYKPNVSVGEIVDCPICFYKFKVIK